MWPRWRFAASIGLYGASLGAAVVITNVIGQTSKFAVDADSLPSGDILYFWLVGAVTGLMVAGLTGYLMNKSSRAFASSQTRSALGIASWAGLGAAYLVSFSTVVGGVVLPEANVLLAYVDGAIPLVDLVGFTLDNVFAIPLRMAVEGARFMFTAIPAALAFAMGGWVIDRLASSTHEPAARYGPPLVAALLSTIVLAGLLLLPPSTLWHIGNVTTATQVVR